MNLQDLMKPHRGIELLLETVLRQVRNIEPAWRQFRELRAVLRPAWIAGLLTVLLAAALQVDQARDVLVQIASDSLLGNCVATARSGAAAEVGGTHSCLVPILAWYPFLPRG